MSFLIIDTETTGFRHWDQHEVIQIAAKALPTGEEFEVKLQFNPKNADPQALQMNSYDPATWEKEAVSLGKGISKFSHWIEQFRTHTRISRKGREYQTAVALGHNYSKFDQKFIQKAFKAVDMFCPLDYICADTMNIIMFLYPDLPQYKQSELMKIAGLSSEGSHDALNDVRQLYDLMQFIASQLASGQFASYFDYLSSGSIANQTSCQGAVDNQMSGKGLGNVEDPSMGPESLDPNGPPQFKSSNPIPQEMREPPAQLTFNPSTNAVSPIDISSGSNESNVNSGDGSNLPDADIPF